MALSVQRYPYRSSITHYITEQAEDFNFSAPLFNSFFSVSHRLPSRYDPADDITSFLNLKLSLNRLQLRLLKFVLWGFAFVRQIIEFCKQIFVKFI